MGHQYEVNKMIRQNRNELHIFAIEEGDTILLENQVIKDWKIREASKGIYELNARLERKKTQGKIETNKQKKKRTHSILYRVKKNNKGELIPVQIAK